MNHTSVESLNRRRFLQFLAGSPVLAGCGTLSRLLAASASPVAGAISPSVADALNVFDLEEAARANLPIAHFAYLVTGVEGEMTLRANREGFAKFQLRPRRLVNTTQLDTKVDIFGTTWPTPIVIAPANGQRGFHPDGEIAVARAARKRNHLQILSTLTGTPSAECRFGFSSIPPPSGRLLTR